MQQILKKVKEFRRKLGLHIAPAPRLLTAKEASFYARFIMEEMSEFLQAHENENIVDAADSIGDLIYMLMGASLMMGLPLEKILEAIHTANMTKVSGMSRRGDNDAIKLPGWVGPEADIKVFLDEARRENEF